MNRKAVSPLIAIVLILVFTVTVGMTVMTWMMDYTKTTTTSVTEATSGEKGVVSCSQEIIDITSVYATDGSIITKFTDGANSKDVFVEGGVGNTSATVTLSKTASITGASVMVSSMYDGLFDETFNLGVDNNATSNTLNTVPYDVIEPIWLRSDLILDSSRTSIPSISTGVVYVGTKSGFYALDILSGETIWNFSDGTICRPATIDGDMIFLGCDGIFYAFDKSGIQMWNITSISGGANDDWFWISVVDGDYVYTNDKDTIYKLDITNGSTIWTINRDINNALEQDHMNLHLAVFGDKLVASNAYDEAVTMYYNTNGSFIWDTATDAMFSFGHASVSDGMIYFTTCSEKLYFAYWLNGTQAWNSSGNSIADDVCYGGVAVDDERIYAISESDNSFFSLWKNNGTTVWSDVNVVYTSYEGVTPLIVGDKVYGLTSDSPTSLIIKNKYTGITLNNISFIGLTAISESGFSITAADNILIVSDFMGFNTPDHVGAFGQGIPANIQIDAGANDADKWAMTGKFNTTALTRVANITTAITNYLSICGTDPCVIPLELEGTSNGTVKMYGLNITTGLPIIKANIVNNGNVDLEINKVVVFSIDGTMCELTPGNTLLEVGDMTQASSSSCSFSCSEILSVKVSTTCGMGDEYIAAIECS